MYKKRTFIDGAFYHVTSRTNDKIRVFDNKLGRKIMLIVLQNAKDKFRFCLTNFCVMPTHIHLLIKPAKGTSLSTIIHWIKLHSAKYWNKIHGSIDHLWGSRYFARAIKDQHEYDFVMNYIDQNAVSVGLASTPADWKASGAYYISKNLPGLIDTSPNDRQPHIKLLSPIPPIVSRLIPPSQLAFVLQYFGPHATDIERLYKLVPTIPRIGESTYLRNPPICLHYITGTADYFIYEYDGADIFYGLYRSSIFPEENKYNKFSLTALKANPHLKLDLSTQR